MALKFLNKKGWHTGSLRNIENVWKAEQKHNAEQSKLEELRKQIQEEREKAEFRQLQEQAGLVPRQERLDFLYESGLAVGKASEGFKTLEAPAVPATPADSTEPSSSKAVVPGALFEDKPQSANDTWRKLHSDPLLLIRQREQEALARIKNNPIQMAMIRKSVEAENKQGKDDKGKREKKRHKRKHYHKLKSERNLDSENTSESEGDRRKRKPSTSNPQKHKRKHSSRDNSEDEQRRKTVRLPSERHNHSSSRHENGSSRARFDSKYLSESEEDRQKSHNDSHLNHERRSSRVRSDSSDSENNRRKSRKGSNLNQENRSSKGRSDSRYSSESEKDRRKSHNFKREKHSFRVGADSRYSRESEEDRKKDGGSTFERHDKYNTTRHLPSLPDKDEETRKQVPSIRPRSEPGFENNVNKENRSQVQQGPGHNRRKGIPKMTEEEREARLREMQLDAELHEEQRWKRIKKAADADAREAARANSSGGKNFLDAAQKSIYGTEKGGSATIEESVRRRAYYSQGKTAAEESNAFRR